jgi:hypothetical protein
VLFWLVWVFDTILKNSLAQLNLRVNLMVLIGLHNRVQPLKVLEIPLTVFNLPAVVTLFDTLKHHGAKVDIGNKSIGLFDNPKNSFHRCKIFNLHGQTKGPGYDKEDDVAGYFRQALLIVFLEESEVVLEQVEFVDFGVWDKGG